MLCLIEFMAEATVKILMCSLQPNPNGSPLQQHWWSPTVSSMGIEAAGGLPKKK